MLLGVVEEERKKEVMDNLGVCAQTVDNIKKERVELEGKREHTGSGRKETALMCSQF